MMMKMMMMRKQYRDRHTLTHTYNNNERNDKNVIKSMSHLITVLFLLKRNDTWFQGVIYSNYVEPPQRYIKYTNYYVALYTYRCVWEGSTPGRSKNSKNYLNGCSRHKQLMIFLKKSHLCKLPQTSAILPRK